MHNKLDEKKFSKQSKSMLKGHNLLGLYEGVPLTERENYTLVLPDKITLFQHSIEHWSETDEEIVDEVKKTVLHEIGHHFGMSEEELNDV